MTTQNEPQDREQLTPIVLPEGPESTAPSVPAAPAAHAPQPSAPEAAPVTPPAAPVSHAAPAAPSAPAAHAPSVPSVFSHGASTEQAQAPGAPAPGQAVPPVAQAPTGKPVKQPKPAKQAKPGEPGRKLPTFLKISIVLLAALSVASISLLFIGDFEGKFERVFSTFCAFAVFVLITAFDTRRGQRNEWYPPVALIANSYILALLLIVVWMSPSGWSLVWDIFWKSLVVILVTRAVVACSQLLLNSAEGKPKPLGVFALTTSLLATLTGILFTAPIAIDVFDVEVPELYWRFSVAALLLTALGLSITLLLRWSYGSADREAAKRAREAAQAQAQAHAQNAAPVGPVVPAGQPYQAQLPPAAQPVAQPGAQGLLPWPTFPDGTPLPAGPDGQPDFSVLGR